MDFIQSSNKQVDKFGVGKHGFAPGNPTLGVLATYFSNTWADGVQQEIINVIEAGGLVASGADLTQLLQAIKKLGQGRLIAHRVWSTAGTFTYTPTPGTVLCRILVVGGGGGGGGAAVSTAGALAVSGGGGGGGSQRGLYPVASVTGQTITVGAGATATSGGGNTGGTSSVGALLSATGGFGGAAGFNATPPVISAPGSAGVGTGGNIFGGRGLAGGPGFGIGISNSVAGSAGGSVLSLGNLGPVSGSAGGNAGSGAGCGGTGAMSQNGAGAQLGGAGAAGLVAIEEFV